MGSGADIVVISPLPLAARSRRPQTLPPLALRIAILFAVASAGCAHSIDRDQTRQRIKDLNQQALAAYQDDDFDGAMASLTKAIEEAKRTGSEHDRLLARTYVHLGVVYLIGYGDRAKALQSFAMARKIRPTIHMTPAIATPEVQAVFDQAPPGPARDPSPQAARASEPDLPLSFQPPLRCGTPRVRPPGKALFIRCGVDPAVKAESVWMHYRTTITEDFHTVPMQRTSKGWYVTTVSGQTMEAYYMQVYFEARDWNGREVANQGQLDRPSTIRICEDECSCDYPDLGPDCGIHDLAPDRRNSSARPDDRVR